MELELKVSKEEGQIILDALIKEPYNEVYQLIYKIQEQSAEQMKGEEVNG